VQPIVNVFQHVACEDLGTFAAVLCARGFRAQYVRLFAGDTIPDDWSAAAASVFLGGPMSVNDAADFPYLAAEKAVIRGALARRLPVLGVCLGAQLLAAAAGAPVYPGPQREIGWEPVTLTPAGRRDPVLACLAPLARVFHWHGETFDLPAGATHLAASAITNHQAFRIGTNAYGLQFHVEVDPSMIDAWIRAYPNDLGSDAGAATRSIENDTQEFAGPLRAAAAAVMSRFLDAVPSGRAA
jgi:GMP synthase (glutamine-hydrolysing)